MAAYLSTQAIVKDAMDKLQHMSAGRVNTVKAQSGEIRESVVIRDARNIQNNGWTINPTIKSVMARDASTML